MVRVSQPDLAMIYDDIFAWTVALGLVVAEVLVATLEPRLLVKLAKEQLKSNAFAEREDRKPKPEAEIPAECSHLGR